MDSRDVLAYVGIHRATLNAWIQAGEFPAPLTLSSSKRFWRRSTILAWAAERDKQPAAPARRSSKKRRR